MPTPLAFSVAIGFIVYLAIPKPTKVSKQAWRLFAIFLTTVAGLILGPLYLLRVFETGLGDRLAMYFVKWFGKSILGLAYGLAIGEAIISPTMPSATARAGGIFLPVINSLAIASGSSPHDGSARKLGAYLIESQLQVHGLFKFEFNNIRIIKSPTDCPIYYWN
ncbi:putative solute carrier family 13 [Helianthus debilis subsp. tardiflorus]